MDLSITVKLSRQFFLFSLVFMPHVRVQRGIQPPQRRVRKSAPSFITCGGCLFVETECGFSNLVWGDCLFVETECGSLFGTAVCWNWVHVLIFELLLFGVAVCLMKLNVDFWTVVVSGGCLFVETECLIFELLLFGVPVAACLMKLNVDFWTVVVSGGCLYDEAELWFSNSCLGWLFVWWNWILISNRCLGWLFVWWNWILISNCCLGRLSVWWNWILISNRCLGFVWWNYDGTECWFSNCRLELNADFSHIASCVKQLSLISQIWRRGIVKAISTQLSPRID